MCDRSEVEELDDNCTHMTIAADREATVKSRNEELNAIGPAKKILSETTSGAVSQSYSLFQVFSKTVSRLQTRADLANVDLSDW